MHPRVLPTLAIALLLLVPAVAMAQEEDTFEQPEYAPGDFWRYALDAELPEEFQSENATVALFANLTWTVEELTEVTVGGETHSAYRVEGVLEVSVSASGSFDFFNETMTLATEGEIQVNHTVYLDEMGLEVLRVEADVDGSLDISSEGITLTVGIEATAHVDFDYTSDTWSFPWSDGETGTEEFATEGEASGTLSLPGSEPLSLDETFNGTDGFHHEVTGHETVSVPAGEFDAWVVKTVDADDPEGDFGWTQAYWSERVGAPVRHEVYNGSGDVQAALNLTDYRYQATEGLQILGVDAVVFIPSVAAIVAAVAIGGWILTRRRPPEQMAPPYESGPVEESEPPEMPPPPSDESEL